MKTYDKTQEDRKILVNRIGELTGRNLTYTKVPRCAYEGFGFTVTKEGNLEADESADAAVIDALIAEGLIAAPETANVTVSLPMGRHNGMTLRNLVNLLFTRASLLNKTLGTAFRVDETLTDALRDESGMITAENFIEAVSKFKNEHGKVMEGLTFEQDKLTFSTLPATDDPAVIKAFTEICSMMNKQALEQNRIQAKTVNDDNEKYAMRIWLVRLGMNGPEHKECRKILMEKLSGNAAFRTDAERQTWLAKQEQKRETLKAIKAAMRRNDEISE